MFISRKKLRGIEKRVADLEKAQSQPVKIEAEKLLELINNPIKLPGKPLF